MRSSWAIYCGAGFCQSGCPQPDRAARAAPHASVTALGRTASGVHAALARLGAVVGDGRDIGIALNQAADARGERADGVALRARSGAVRGGHAAGRAQLLDQRVRARHVVAALQLTLRLGRSLGRGGALRARGRRPARTQIALRLRLLGARRWCAGRWLGGWQREVEVPIARAGRRRWAGGRSSRRCCARWRRSAGFTRRR
jgi:hypothetical protein